MNQTIGISYEMPGTEPATNPTQRTYRTLDDAYAFFNERLFDGRLPACLITLQRKSKSLGYFHGNRFGSRDGAEITDELALNPSQFINRTSEQTLSTLVHEMTHVEQHHFGTPSGAHHNKEWGTFMDRVGLVPSHTGMPGGKRTGQRMTHYIEPGGPFDLACAELIRAGFDALYIERGGDPEKAKKKSASKTKYTCPACDMNAWGKPDIRITCTDCDEPMRAEAP